GREEGVDRGASAEDVEGEEQGHHEQLLGSSEDPKEDPSMTPPTDPGPEPDDALARAKQTLLSVLQPSQSPSNTTNRDSSPPPAPPESALPTQNDDVNHPIHISEDNPATKLSIHPQPARRNDLDLYATLDMIITIVGEFYGQRDLLEGRDLWDEVYEGG
ncbi:MAG: hypothetical protein LQ347_006375, partial [Umbilicaria vellea]